jgi:pilus assembly protein CpaF
MPSNRDWNHYPDLHDPSNGSSTDGAGEQRFLRLKRELHEQLISKLDLSAIGRISEQELRLEVRRAAEELCRMGSDLLSHPEQERLVNEVLDETFGFGPLETLMRDPTISDILINGAQTVYVERNGRLERAKIAFNDDKHLVQIVQRIVERVGRRVDETRPTVDARLPDGSRINAVIAPLALDGPLVSIRRFGSRPLSASDLLNKRALTKEMSEFLSSSPRSAAPRSQVVPGHLGAKISSCPPGGGDRPQAAPVRSHRPARSGPRRPDPDLRIALAPSETAAVTFDPISTE